MTNKEEQLNLNFERPTAEELTEKIFEKIIEEAKNKKIELEDVNRIIKDVLGKNHLDPNIDTDIFIPIIGLVLPNYKNKIKEALYRVIKQEPQEEEKRNKGWARRHEEQTGQWDY